MVKITEVRFVRSFVNIRTESGASFWLRQDDLAGTNFSEGAELEEEEFLQAVRVRQYPHALELAVSMLARRPCSKGEILSRLKTRRYMDDVAELVVYKLEKENLLDDRDFCEQWIRYRLARHYGPAVIRQELRMKGVPADIIDEAFDRTDTEDEVDHALLLARKAWKRTCKGEDIRKSRQKVIASLVRKGFSWEQARHACAEAEREAEDN